MDPVTLTIAFVIASALVGYLTSPRDTKTLRATRGTAGAVRSTGRGVARSVRSQVAEGRPARDARRKAWSNGNRRQRAALVGERATVGAYRAARATKRHAARTAHDATQAWAEGYRTAAKDAEERKAAKKAAKAAQTTNPTTPRPTPIRPEASRTAPATSEPAGGAPMNGMPIPNTELENLDAQAAEVTAAQHRIADLEEIVSVLDSWETNYPDRMVGPNVPRIKAIDAAVVALSDLPKIGPLIEAHKEAVATLQAAIGVARGLGETLSEHGATGDTKAFQAA